MPDLTIPHSRIQCIFQSEVYSLSADSWRKVDGVRCSSESFRGSRTYTNGMVSWEAHCHDWDGVLSFDMSDEVFLKTSMPDDVTADCCKHLFVLNELIAMAVIPVEEYEEWLEVCFDIWLMHEVGVRDSWTKLFTIGPFTEIERPLGVWKNDTIFLEKSERQLVLYEPSTKEMTNLQIGHEATYTLQLITYMETLVSVKGGNEFEEQGNC
ncbi:hypothetical protein FH972_000448 [Carpinus fangiana]|uniref:F-box associated beta-propeller type 1 domain-containing protein n=1 Tax=Carpinus fangiana TaxID=176857 RepID=A0A5N6Q8W0_9ROSI|nr:hypothetical protein FH972_000448 [Carpinus fangiana]